MEIQKTQPEQLREVFNWGAHIGTNENYIWNGARRRSPGYAPPVIGKDEILHKSNQITGTANRVVGQKCVGELDGSFIASIAKFFLDFVGSENVIVKYATRIFDAVHAYLFGKRDTDMYNYIFSHGINATEDEIINQKKAITEGIQTRKGINRVDDLLVNEQEIVYGERVVGLFGRLATKAANLKPWVNSLGALFGDRFRSAIETLSDIPARAYWRFRFFGQSLHGNFVTTIWDLGRLGFMSLFNPKARTEFTKLTDNLKTQSTDYLKKRGISYGDDAGWRSLYSKVIGDRLKEHWTTAVSEDKAIKVLEEKNRAGLIKFKNETKDNRRNEMISEQRISSMTDFTGPISAAFGLAASFIFDPLSCLWKVFNIEKGKNLISFGSSLRKPLHLLNYIFRFMLPELKEGSKVFELNKQIKSSDATEATKQLYLARRDRYINALFGITMSIGSIFEPLVHLKSQLFESNRFMTFMKNIFLRFNDCGLLRFFSRRREVQGRIIQLRSLAREELLNNQEIEQNVKDRIINDGSITSDDYNLLPLTKEKLLERFQPVLDILRPELHGAFRGPSHWVSNLLNTVREKFLGSRTIMKVPQEPTEAIAA